MTSRVDRQIKKAYLVAAAALVEGRVSLDQMDEAGLNVERPIFTVGQVAQVADIHPQTLRQYDKLNLIVPRRTPGGARRYSLRDVDRLTQAQHLAQDESINLAGIARILQLDEENRQLRRQIARLKRGADSFFAAAVDGEVVEIRRSRRTHSWRRSLFKPLQLTASVEDLDERDSRDADDVDDDVDAGDAGAQARGGMAANRGRSSIAAIVSEIDEDDE